MKKILFIFAIVALAACSKKEERPVVYGEISVAPVSAQVKAIVPMTPEQLACYNVAVYNSEGEIQGASRKYSEFTVAKVPVDHSYYVTAESCTLLEAESGSGCVRYAGRSETFALTLAVRSHEAQVVCTMANAHVQVAFDESALKVLSDIRVSLYTNPTRSVEISSAASLREAYFNVGEGVKLNYAVEAVSTVTGQKISSSKVLDINAGDNIQLMVKAASDNGLAAVPQLSVQEETTNVNERSQDFDIYDYE